MKKIIVLSLILLGFSSSPLLTSADIIPTGMHSVSSFAYITNLSDFPNVYLISTTDEYGKQNNVIVKSDTRLYRRTYEFFVVDKKYIDSIGVQNFVTPKDGVSEKGTISFKKWFDNDGGYVSDANPLKEQSINYLLVKETDGNFFLQKDKTISEYNLLLPIYIIVGLLFSITFLFFRIKKTKERKIIENKT